MWCIHALLRLTKFKVGDDICQCFLTAKKLSACNFPQTCIFNFRMKKQLLLIAIVTCSYIVYAQSNCLSNRYKQAVFDSVKVTSGIQFGTSDPYGINDQQQLFLDIYEPIGDTVINRPVIVYAFGGGFLIGTRNQPPIPYYGNFFAKLGYVFVAIDYRLGFSVTTPGSPERAVYRAVQDLRAAERHLAQRADLYKIDTSKIILSGSSAGCFAGFHSTYMEYAQAATFAATIPVLDPEVLGGVDSSGNADFNYKYIEPFAIINQWGALADTNWIDTDERCPVISFHGDQDNAVPYIYGYPFSYPVFPNVYGSKPIHERLNHLGIQNKLYTLVGYGHEPELLNLDLRDTILQESRDFLYPLLQPKTSNINGPLSVCTASEETYSITNTPGSKYCWQLTGNGVITQNNGSSIKVMWNDTGWAKVQVREINHIGASGDLKELNIYIKKKVNAGFGYQINDLQVSLLDFSVGAESLVWNFGDGNNSSLQNPTVSYLQSGTYTITQIADNGVCPDTFTTTLTVDSCPVAFFTQTLLNNLSVVFNAQPTNTTQYVWDFGDGFTTNTASPNVLHMYQQQGNYIVSVKVQNLLVCADTFTANLSLITSLQNQFSNFHFVQNENLIAITAPHTQPIRWALYNANGLLIYSGISAANLELQLPDLPKGIYILTATSPDGVYTRKFLKE